MSDTTIELGKEDIAFTCRNPRKNPDCMGEDFWERGEQRFMLKLKEEGKVSEVKQPSLCKNCRAARKAAQAQRS